MSTQIQLSIYELIKDTLIGMYIGRIDLAVDFTAENFPDTKPTLSLASIEVSDPNAPGLAELLCRSNLTSIADSIPISMLDDLYNCSQLHEAVAQIFAKYEYETRQWLAPQVASETSYDKNVAVNHLVDYLTGKK